MKYYEERINGYDVHVHEAGEGHATTMVLVHGIGVSHAYFLPFMKAAAQDYHVIALDLPGYGKTDDPKNVLSIDELADVVNCYVSQHTTGKVVLAGHSMGTQIAIQAVRDAPKLYKKVIVMAPTINKHERNLAMQAVRLLQDTFREPWSVNKIVLRDYWRMGVWRYLVTTHSMLSDSIEDDITHVKVPILIVNGTNDPICPDEWADLLARKAPLATKVDIHGAPHVFQFSYPRELLDQCKKFIN